jgi:hypothetical protein
MSRISAGWMPLVFHGPEVSVVSDPWLLVQALMIIWYQTVRPWESLSMPLALPCRMPHCGPIRRAQSRRELVWPKTDSQAARIEIITTSLPLAPAPSAPVDMSDVRHVFKRTEFT